MSHHNRSWLQTALAYYPYIRTKFLKKTPWKQKMDFKNEVMNIQVRVIVARVYYMTKYSTVRPRNTQPQATMTSQVHFFKLGPKKKRWKNLCSENLEQLVCCFFLAFTWLCNQKLRKFWTAWGFSFPKTRTSQGLTLFWFWHFYTAWDEEPTTSQTVVRHIKRVTFPTVTLCPRTSTPDRWGPTIKIFDHLKRRCMLDGWEIILSTLDPNNTNPFINVIFPCWHWNVENIRFVHLINNPRMSSQIHNEHHDETKHPTKNFISQI